MQSFQKTGLKSGLHGCKSKISLKSSFDGRCRHHESLPDSGLEFRASVYGDAGTGDPAGAIRGEEGDYVSYVFRLADAFERLHGEGEFAAGFGLGEVGHVGLDDAGGDGVDANALRAEDGCPVLD